ncbi:MAG: hypothetical protein A3I04_07365 [Nitrospinae bacterium RIFCSPLOWO2_02_FULL_39_110]|nr:MAG: hypothetical protein A2W53_02690 [Nitrospinae bacterium RIFCSPHIGHO2_02_39_11]OGV97721.1 MAG: hypothetical protein A3D97_05355 [Nitrospinae bacterium RIFCSPHIGHO2_12_FULL_39_42]OGW02855.1 MAG: hypothetical protein A3D20_05985 [Nitrospinae bacterium RIFCSPHIGHO2_02_FULL_39_82]OGW05850.1 MAG: hypothetical protein A2Z59_04245 [Nitrospinae bacterium RIFCSPLOWO2_02_39_17]OGW07439.1 MAG: hypothetical protein A3I04_07365 [Nitrospinae bacterium RIFCSPLOWO2_02_FULL_39_110]OGW07701.1 MAG: hypoth
MQNSKFKINEDGLTIIELLIAMSIGLVVLGSVFSSFTTQKKAFDLQEQITEMEQNLRFPIDFITRDLRNAGANPNINTTMVIGTSVGLIPNDPNDSDDPNVPITTDSIKILSDIDGNGSIPTTDTDVDEKITYTLNGTTLERNGNPLVDYITALTFTYFDSAGNTIATPITTTTNLSNIRVVQVSLTARTEYEDPNYTGGVNISGTAADGTCKARTLTVRVRIRNIGLQG